MFRFNSRIVTLDLRMCPMTSVKTYHALAVRRLPSLTQLDGKTVTARDRHHANTRGASISPSVLRAACKFRPSILTSMPAAAAAAKLATCGPTGGYQNSSIEPHSTESAAVPDIALMAEKIGSAAFNPLASTPTGLEAHASTTLTLRHSGGTVGKHGEPPLSDAVEVVLQVRFARLARPVECCSDSRVGALPPDNILYCISYF